MKCFIAALCMLLASKSSFAAPSASAVEACLKAETVGGAIYKEWKPSKFARMADEKPHRKEVIRTFGDEMVGLWENEKTNSWGLSYNGRDIPRKAIVRLDRKQAPQQFEAYKASWGEVNVDKKRLICITFNFDGLGSSGSYQDIRGIYLIEPKERGRAYYSAGNIANFPK